MILTRPILILAGIAVLVVMGAGIFLFNGGFFDRNNSQLVIIEAIDTPVKIRPDDPGGLEIDNLDSPTLGLLDAPGDNASTPEVLTANTPPEPPPISVEVPEVVETVPEAPPESVSEAIETVLGVEASPSLKKTITDDAFVVQFAAFKNREQSALETAATLGQKHQSRLGGLTIGYIRHNDSWLVISDPLPAEEARALCVKFRSHGQDCFVKQLESP